MKQSKPNKLINEKSPYLLQHAYNPVDWFPWGEEAFNTARRKDKPIFLSIGYSTCYWCHVMEREVFENERIAEIMNQLFVNIKVDREERPDIDRVYMTALQAMTGSGGWPMSMFLTPELKPFYGATYIPPVAKYGQSGFLDVIKGIDNAWKNRRSEILKSGEKIIAYLESLTNSQTEISDFNESIFHKCYEQCSRLFDNEYGGFGNAPKFPRPVLFNFLLRYYNRFKEQKALDMVTFTLDKMAKGGDYDQLGGGFHRYSVDKFWRVPHFEKMLYDQAQLTISYLESYQLTGEKYFGDVAKDVLNYVEENLTDKTTGGFYSAEDAESHVSGSESSKKCEGAFYIWDKSEILTILGDENGEIFSYYYDIGSRGNIPAGSDPHNVFTDKNILYVSKTIPETADKFGISTDKVYRILTQSKEILFTSRKKRPKPHLDDKILTSWNALTISAYARAYQVFYDIKYLNSAKRATDFILDNLYNKSDKTLLHRWRDGESRYEGTLHDYAYFIQSLLDLYETCFVIKYLEIANELNKRTIELFYDNENGGFFDVSEYDKSIIIRTKEDYDSAEPTGNSIAIMNLLRLAQFTDNNVLFEKAEKSLRQFSSKMSTQPFAMPQMLCALDYYFNKPKQIIISGEKDNLITQEMLKEIHQHFIPNKILIYTNPKEKNKLIPYLEEIIKLSEKTFAYVCENYTCKLPTESIEELRKLL